MNIVRQVLPTIALVAAVSCHVASVHAQGGSTSNSSGTVDRPVGGSAVRDSSNLDYRAAADYSTANEGVSLLAMQSGEIVFEDYVNGGGPETAWVTASGTKSFWGVLLAAMVQDGEARIDELVSDTVTEWQADPLKNGITVSHLLYMTDGLRGQPPGPGAVETYAEAVALPLAHPPGSAFVYRPAPFQVFGEWVRRKMAGRYSDAVDYMQERIFDHLGIAPAYWPTEADGLPRMPSSSEWTARDWAVFGEFVRLGGSWNDQQLVDPAALAANFVGSAANADYGLGWWLVHDTLPDGVESPPERAIEGWPQSDDRFPGLMYIARGGGNQRMYIVPEWELVIVRQQRIGRTGPVRSDFSDLEFWQELVGGEP